MFCSTIIPTVGRDALTRAVHSVLEQSVSETSFELIVVNDSGTPLPAQTWMQDRRVRVVNTRRRERAVARNVGAAIAHGQFLHFLDDDDWLAPGALAHFLNKTVDRDVGWIYGVSELVDRQGRTVLQLRHNLHGNCFLPVMAGEWIPLQSSLISAEAFFAVGGFNPQLTGPEDIDLLRRIALRYDLDSIDEVVAFIERGEEGSTTDYDRHPQISRRARENILEESGVFARLRPFATNPYWQGRLARLYLTSTVWNVRRLRALTALSRALYALRAFLSGGASLFSPDFWGSLRRAYESPTFASGLAAARRAGTDAAPAQEREG